MKDVIPPNVDFSKYIGQWVVMCKNQIVAHNRNLSKLKKEIKACKRTPKIVKIPEKDTLIF